MILAPLTEAELIQEQPSASTPKNNQPEDTLAPVIESEKNLTSSFIGKYYYLLLDSRFYAIASYT